MKITSEIVKTVWAELPAKYGATVTSKDDSVWMRACAGFLDLLGILEPEVFMRRYATTIGREIFVPFVPGYRNVDGSWLLTAQLITCAHECRHVQQYEDDKSYPLQYLLSTGNRAVYEAQAYTVNMELGWHLFKHTPNPDTHARKLKSYGCSESDIKVARTALDSAASTILAGGVINRQTRETLEIVQRLQ
jgi:hypothetical protein